KASLEMRDFTDGFLENYLETVEPRVFESVGGYQLEGLGAHLMASIHGDNFTILGLPLLEVLDFLRNQGAVVT
ncbi:MAG: Maf family protein, partial [Pseudomonadota bacterium]